MQKQLGASMLVAGTCIGSGMIALPLVLSQIGLIPSAGLMFSIWFVMYYSSLINLELNLQAGRGLSLGDLGRYFSGKTAEMLGVLSLKLLSYSLLAAFIYGGTSILNELLEIPFEAIAICYSTGAILMLLLPIKWLDYLNRAMFFSLIAIVFLLLSGLILSIKWSYLPWFGPEYANLESWALLIPVVFTSFGFQVIFHTLTNYCHNNAKVLKKAFFFGSLIPAFIYLFWTSSILSVVFHNNPEFYAKMVADKAEIGELMELLSSISEWGSIQVLIWAISSLAIATSVLGVGVGLNQSIDEMLSSKISSHQLRSLTAAILTILPAFLVVLFVPNAFISVLGFAGMILAFIAILLPAYLFFQIETDQLFYPELNNKFLIWLSCFVATAVIGFQMYNMLT